MIFGWKLRNSKSGFPILTGSDDNTVICFCDGLTNFFFLSIYLWIKNKIKDNLEHNFIFISVKYFWLEQNILLIILDNGTMTPVDLH